MLGSGGGRARWADLPGDVHDAVGAILGSPVVGAVSQPGGFSPGTADRVVTGDGGRAFVKAVSAALNPESPDLHRAEARIASRLPRDLPVPHLLGDVEVVGWVVLVFADVPGRHPSLPWAPAELDAVLDGLHRLATLGTPCPVPDLPTATARLDGMLRGADRLAADGEDVPLLPRLQELSARARDRLGGDTLVHCDLRADNILLTDAGAVFVDWPWACRGPAWLDTLLLLMEVQRLGGHDVDALLAAHPHHTPSLRSGGSARTRCDTGSLASSLTGAADPDDLSGVLAGLAGFFLDAARRPDPPGLPTLRAFQRVQGEALLEWLRSRGVGASG